MSNPPQATYAALGAQRDSASCLNETAPTSFCENIARHLDNIETRLMNAGSGIRARVDNLLGSESACVAQLGAGTSPYEGHSLPAISNRLNRIDGLVADLENTRDTLGTV